VRYRPDILALYGQLFGDAHAALTKEAGVADWLARRFYAGPRQVRQYASMAGKAQEELAQLSGRHEQVVSDTAHRLQQADFDRRLYQGQAERANKELSALGAKPGEVSSLRRKAMIGGGLGLAGLAGAPLAYGAGQQQGEANKKRTRNIAFGAGAAAGLAAPQVIRGLGNIARGVGQTGLYPELENVPDFSGIPGGY
jgi:hypothetical protein